MSGLRTNIDFRRKLKYARRKRRDVEDLPEQRDVEHEAGKGHQRERAEEGRAAHAQRQLLGLHVAVDVEGAGEVCQQGLVVVVDALALRGVESHYALLLQGFQLALEDADLVGAGLVVLAGEGVMASTRTLLWRGWSTGAYATCRDFLTAASPGLPHRARRCSW